MASKRIRLGDYLELCEEKNTDERLGVENVRGISTQKEFIETKANMDGVPLSGYRVVPPNCFAYVPDTSRRGDKISLAFNDTDSHFLVSSISIVFKICNEELSPYYLFMFFNRPEFDRYARFNSFGSARETFNWEDMCDIRLDLPKRPVQDKFVAIYLSLLKNQNSYQSGLDDLKLVCDGFIDDLLKKFPRTTIGQFIRLSEERNSNNGLGLDAVRGISIQKAFIETKADMVGVSLTPYLLVKPKSFAYVPVTSRNGDKITLGFNNSEDTYLVSSSYIVFSIIDSNLLDPDYLFMLFNRPEFDRYSRFCSWGSAREVFSWEEMQNVALPIPDIGVQRSIAKVFKAYQERKIINEDLKKQLQSICPILIKGSIEEGRRS